MAPPGFIANSSYLAARHVGRYHKLLDFIMALTASSFVKDDGIV
jgi:hypothetical protein